MYLNDIEHFILINFDSVNSFHDPYLDRMLNVFSLINADDTVLFATSEAELKKITDVFVIYCVTWKLNMNIKIKVIVFGHESRGQLDIKINSSRQL